NCYFNFIYQPTLDKNNQINGIVVFAVEVTEQVVARQKVEKLNHDLSISESKYRNLSKDLEIKVQQRTLELSDAKKEVEYHSNKLSSLLMNAPASICLLEGPEHTFQFMNPEYKKLIGGREIIGKKVREALPELVGQGLYELLDDVYQTGKPFLGNELPISLDNSYGDLIQSYLNFVYQPVFNTNNEVEGISVFVFNVTQQVLARQQVDNLYKEVQRSNDELQNFAYIVSHDLQAPLRSITGYINLLTRRSNDKFTPSEREFMNFITDGAKRMHLLISSLLEYSKIGAEKIKFTPTDLNKLMETTIADLRAIINDNQASVNYEGLPTLNVEQNHILRLFENLIINSLKYRSDRKPEILISAKKEDNYYVFSVSDNGIGIEKKDLNRIFDIFQRLHNKENVEGTGIGLA
ncbi:hypothetical protein EON78_05750, partial [bacterium]